MEINQKINKILEKEAGDYPDDFNIDTSNKNTYKDIVISGLSNKVNLNFDEDRIKKNHDYLLSLADKRKAVYGLTTSFGGNIHYVIPPEEAKTLQSNLIKSHATNVGQPLPRQISKSCLLRRLLTITKGHSGISKETIDSLLKLLNNNLIPVIKTHGSVGARGDLGPLAQISLVLLGEGNVWKDSEILPTKDLIKKGILNKINLTYKEGLGLINGTGIMTSIGSYELWYLKRIIENSILITALTIEAFNASKKPFDERLHKFKPHPYQIKVAKVLSKILEESDFAKSHAAFKEDIEKNMSNRKETFLSKTDLQGGSYSLRAIPQVYSPILTLLKDFEETINTEINSIDDNPIILDDEEDELHGANFHGHPISVISDSLNLAISSIGNISMARISRILKKHHSNLPWFLSTGKEGLYLGFQGAEYTAAGILSEIRNSCFPYSINQIPTNNDNQDMVSFGLQSVIKGLNIISLLSYILSIEALSAVQAIWIMINSDNEKRSINYLSPYTRVIFEEILKIYTPKKGEDANLVESIEKVSDFLLMKSFLPEETQYILYEKEDIRYISHLDTKAHSNKDLEKIGIQLNETGKIITLKDSRSGKYFFVALRGDKKIDIKKLCLNFDRIKLNKKDITFASSDDLNKLGLKQGNISPLKLNSGSCIINIKDLGLDLLFSSGKEYLGARFNTKILLEKGFIPLDIEEDKP